MIIAYVDRRFTVTWKRGDWASFIARVRECNPTLIAVAVSFPPCRNQTADNILYDELLKGGNVIAVLEKVPSTYPFFATSSTSIPFGYLDYYNRDGNLAFHPKSSGLNHFATEVVSALSKKTFTIRTTEVTVKPYPSSRYPKKFASEILDGQFHCDWSGSVAVISSELDYDVHQVGELRLSGAEIQAILIERLLELQATPQP